jgi:hypothetical protein
MNFFESRVNAIGTIEDKEKMSQVISKWESLKTHTMKEGIAMASEEAVVEEVVIPQAEVEATAKTAKEIKKQAYLSAAQLRKAIKKNPSKSNLKQLADLEAFIAEFYILTDLGIILKTQELLVTYK